MLLNVNLATARQTLQRQVATTETELARLRDHLGDLQEEAEALQVALSQVKRLGLGEDPEGEATRAYKVRVQVAEKKREAAECQARIEAGRKRLSELKAALGLLAQGQPPLTLVPPFLQ